MAIAEIGGYKGVASRAAFLIGTDRRVRYAWYAPDLGTLPNADEVLSALSARG